MARKKEQANTEKKVERPGKPARGSRRMHPAGPHARPELTEARAGCIQPVLMRAPS